MKLTRNTCLLLNLVLSLIETSLRGRGKDNQRVVTRKQTEGAAFKSAGFGRSRHIPFLTKQTMSRREPEPRGDRHRRLGMLFKCDICKRRKCAGSREGRLRARRRRVALRYKQLSEVKRGRSAWHTPERVTPYGARLIITQICSSFTGRQHTSRAFACPRRYTCDTCRACPFSCTFFRYISLSLLAFSFSLRCAFQSIQFRRSKKWSMYMSRTVCEIRLVYTGCVEPTQSFSCGDFLFNFKWIFPKWKFIIYCIILCFINIYFWQSSFELNVYENII